MKRVLLVDDHTLFRETLRRLLEADRQYGIAGEFADLASVGGALEQGLQFDLALVDYQLGGREGEAENGMAVLEMLRRRRPGVPVLMVTAGMRPADLLQAVRELHVGIFLKSEPAAELLMAMEKTLRGELWVSSGAALSLLSEQSAPQGNEAAHVALTPRERAVLRRILEGLSNKEIGVQLAMSESLVKSVVQKLFEKLGVRTRSQLVRIAIESQMDLEDAEGGVRR